MKKIWKILSIVMALSLMIGLLVIGVMAADTSEEELASPWQYVDSSGNTKTAATIGAALSAAKSGSTIKLLSNTTTVTPTGDGSFASASKPVTIDLGGYTWKISQSGKSFFSVNTTKGFVVENGTIIASANSSYGSSTKGYNVFRPGIAGATITLNNLTTYTPCLVQDGWSGNVTVNINGGNHYLPYTATDLCGGGLVETRRNANVNVIGANIYLSGRTALFNSLIYGAVGGTSTPYSNYTFKDCTIIPYTSNAQIVGNSTEYTKVVFDNCDIYGSIDPLLHVNDSNKGVAAMKSGAITLKNGTRLGCDSSQIINTSLFSSDSVALNIWDVVKYNTNAPVGSLYYDTTNGTIADISFSTKKTEVKTIFTNAFGDEAYYPFVYDISGREFSTDDLVSALELSNSYIKLNGDYTFDIDSYEMSSINKKLTIDLNGYTLTVKGDSAKSLELGEGGALRLVNGMLVKCGKASADSKVSPLFSFVGDNAKLYFENVNLVAGALAYNGGYKGISLEIKGGSFNGTAGANTEWGGFIESHSEMTVAISGATLVADEDSYLFSFGSLSDKDGATKLTLKGCKVIAKDEGGDKTNIVRYANADTKIIIDGGYVYGIINPTLNIADKKAEIGKDAITVKSGTALVVSSDNIAGGVITIPSGYVYNTASVTDTAYYYNNSGIGESASLKYDYKIGKPSANAVLTYVSGGIVNESADFKAAIPLAEENTTVTLLKNVTLTESQKGFLEFKKPITLDLNGFSIELIQEGEAHFYVKADITVKNGTLRSAMNASAAYPGRSYPMFCYGVSMKGLTINLENVNSYAGSLVFAWNCSGNSLNVVGGQHVALNRGTGNDNGWLDVRGDFEFTATDALFVSNEYSQIISSLSFKDWDTTYLAANFTFNNCDLITEKGTSTILGCANENSTFVFNGCNIYGRINPTLKADDQNAGYSAIKAGAIILGEGTRLLGKNDIAGDVITADNGLVITNKEYTKTISYKSYTIDSTTGKFTFTDKTVEVTLLKQVTTPENAYVFINFYKEDGKTIYKTLKLQYGESFTAPSYTAAESNGWFKTTYSGWTTAVGSTNVVTSFKATADTNYYPAVGTDITPNITAALYNLTLTGKIRNNFYLPEAPEGIEIIGVYDVNGNKLSGQRVVFNGGETVYTLYILGEVGAAELTKATNISVKFSLLGNEYTQYISLSPSQYAAAILKDSVAANPSFPSTAHTLVSDLVRYSNSLCYAINGEEDSTLSALLEEYPAALSPLPSNNAFANYTTNTTGIAGVIASIQLEVSSTEPRWIFNIASGVSVNSITITTEGYLPSVVDGVNFGRITYKTTKSENGKVFYTENIPMYNLDRVLNIEVALENGEIRRATYNLDAYYKGFSAEGGSYTAVRDFLRSFRAFAASSSGYKYGDKIVKEGGTLDFFECEHKHVGAFYESKGRLCPDCATYIFFYSDFGAVADGVSDRALNASGTNDFDAIYECHVAANTWAMMGVNVAVSAVGGSHNRTNYYIGAPTNNSSIPIETDVLWRGANIIVDDRTVGQTAETNNIPVFLIRRSSDNPTIDYTAKFTGPIGPGSTNIGFAPGAPTMIKIVDKTIRHYIRQGANANSGDEQSEMLILDEYGNISSTTIPEWDYIQGRFCKSSCTVVDANADKKCDTCNTTITSSVRITGWKTTDKPIRVSGLDLDGNIAFTWENVTNDQVDTTEYAQSARTIRVSRSNVVVEGIDRYFTEDKTNVTARLAYSGIVNPSLAENLVMKDMKVVQHIGHYVKDANGNNTSNSLGSYEFSGGDSVNISWINCQVKNFFNSSGSVTYRGLFGTNRMRNMYLKNCVLNSFDAHSGANNVTIEDSTFEHINYIGAGDIVLNNVTVYTTTSYKTIAILRQDYGGTWHGNMYVNDVRVRYTTSDVPAYIDIIRSYYTDHYFGYSTYLPENMYINNVTTEGYSRTTPDYEAENGIIKETITATNKVPIAIHKYLATQLTKHIDYTTVNDNNKNPRVCTKNVYITNVSASIVYPDHPFFRNMKVYIDGVEKTNWYSQRSSITCVDLNGDYVCDTCKTAITCTATHPTSGNSTTTCSTCKASISKTGSGCVSGDTLIALADGGVVRVDELKATDKILAWNFETGSVEAVSVAKILNHGFENNTVLELFFEDGTSVKVINYHQFFSASDNDFVTIDKNNAESYLGDEFVKLDNDTYTTVKLVDYKVSEEYIEAYAVVSALHYNVFVNGLISMDFRDEDVPLFRPFEIGEDMKFDEEKMNSDIEKYGLYTYEDFKEHISYEQFVLFNFKYMRVAVGKGIYTYDGIIALIERYLE